MYARFVMYERDTLCDTSMIDLILMCINKRGNSNAVCKVEGLVEKGLEHKSCTWQQYKRKRILFQLTSYPSTKSSC